MEKEWVDANTVKEVILTEVIHDIPSIENEIIYWTEKELEATTKKQEAEAKLAELLKVQGRPQDVPIDNPE